MESEEEIHKKLSDYIAYGVTIDLIMDIVETLMADPSKVYTESEALMEAFQTVRNPTQKPLIAHRINETAAEFQKLFICQGVSDALAQKMHENYDTTLKPIENRLTTIANNQGWYETLKANAFSTVVIGTLGTLLYYGIVHLVNKYENTPEWKHAQKVISVISNDNDSSTPPTATSGSQAPR